MSKFDARLELVPESPGVYLMKDAEGSIIYVGKAIHLRNRLRSYFQTQKKSSYRTEVMVNKIADFSFVLCDNELEALVLESSLIKRYQPLYNVLLKDDKDYPYLLLDFTPQKPAIKKVYRKENSSSSKHIYFGPFLNGDLYKLLSFLKRLFPIASCGRFSVIHRAVPLDSREKIGRPCLHYDLGTCIGTCCGKISAEEYIETLHEVKAFMEGEYEKFQSQWSKEMKEASDTWNFEKAAQLRDQLEILEQIKQKQRVLPSFTGDADVIDLAVEEGKELACVQKLEIRNGRIVGAYTFFLEGGMKETEAIAYSQQVLQQFLLQNYVDENEIHVTSLRQKKHRKLHLWLPEKVTLEMAQLLEDAYLLIYPRRGEKADVLNMARQTAQKNLQRKLLMSLSKNERQAQEQQAWLCLERLAHLGKQDRRFALKRLEAYDVSHLGIADFTCSMTVFKEGRACKEQYRQFHFEREGIDDYESMYRAIERRLDRLYDRDFGAVPDLLLLDGGKGHVQKINALLKEKKVPFRAMGMVKNDKHKTRGLVLANGECLELLQYLKRQEVATTYKKILAYEDVLPLLRLLTKIQDETHRRAQKAQQIRHKKRSFQYRLEEIKGIGPKKRQLLLECFSSLKEMEESTLQELQEKTSFPLSLCENIYSYFHSKNNQNK